MLLIHGIELVAVEQFLGPGHFDDERPFFIEKIDHAGHEMVQVSDMIEGVGRDDDLRGASFGTQHLGGCRVEIGDVHLTPCALACSARFAAGSTPSVLQPRSLQALSSSPSLQPISTISAVPGLLSSAYPPTRRNAGAWWSLPTGHRDSAGKKSAGIWSAIWIETAMQARLRIQGEAGLGLVDLGSANEHVGGRMIAQGQKKIGLRRQTGAAVLKSLHHSTFQAMRNRAVVRTVGRTFCKPFEALVDMVDLGLLQAMVAGQQDAATRTASASG